MSNRTVISVEGLSKKFILDHENQERYSTFRDNITKNLKKLSNVFNKSKSNTGSQSKEEFWALKDLNFEIEQGDRVGIIGRNGAGKSTLLKILSRITPPTEGRVRINGKVASLLEVGTGFHPELTGRENVFLNGAILGMSRAEIRKKFDEIVDFAEVEKFLDTPVKRYSSGMYVRLAFAVAAHLEPEILIIDEVLAVGDAQFQKKCLGKMQDVSTREGKTVLFVSHNLGIISQLCNKSILLNMGQIIENGTVQHTINSYLSLGKNNINIYEHTGGTIKINYFTKVSTANEGGLHKSEFLFSDPIHLYFDFIINELNPNILIGIGLQDKFNQRVSTVLKTISFFCSNNGNQYKGKLELPGGLFAPNSYSFVLVIWDKNVNVYDQLENICSIQIFDNGTENAAFEGLAYGNIIINPIWSSL